MAAFLKTQVFEQFNKQREENKDLYVGPFEQNVKMLNQFEKASLYAGSEKERMLLQSAISTMTTSNQPANSNPVGGFFDRLFGTSST